MEETNRFLREHYIPNCGKFSIVAAQLESGFFGLTCSRTAW